jgi:hypothetical protein
VLSDYTQRIVGDIKLTRPMKIVVDSGNGIAGASAPGIFRALGCEVIELFSEVDGHFPNHHPDPSKPENLQDLIQALKTSGAELGLAFDGDGDRLGIVTQDGTNIYPDRQMQLFAEDVLSRVPGGTILFDVKCSQRLAPAIEAAGGKALMYKTGHSLIKAQMKAIEAAGGLPIIVPVLTEPQAVTQFTALLDGLLMVGGPAIEDGLIGQLPPDLDHTDPARQHADALIFNALIIPALVPLALKGVKYRPASASQLLSRNLLVFGLGGIVSPFIGIKIIDLAIGWMF